MPIQKPKLNLTEEQKQLFENAINFSLTSQTAQALHDGTNENKIRKSTENEISSLRGLLRELKTGEPNRAPSRKM